MTPVVSAPLVHVSAGRTAAAASLATVAIQLVAEESPGSMDQRWRLTAAGGDPRESATEIKPPRSASAACGKGEMVR